jgi:hypothetical protein
LARCRWCDRSGWLLSANQFGVCGSCAPTIGLDISQRVRILQESAALAENGKTLSTRLSRCDLAIEHARALTKYEEKGISVLSIPPSTIARELEERRTRLVLDGLGAELDEAKRKANVAPPSRSRVTAYSKVLLHIQEFRGKVVDCSELKLLEKQVEQLIQETQLTDHLEEARKLEFKGQGKKALDRCYEALYLLRHDSVLDDLQAGSIGEIEAKIRDLGGEVR